MRIDASNVAKQNIEVIPLAKGSMYLKTGIATVAILTASSLTALIITGSAFAAVIFGITQIVLAILLVITFVCGISNMEQAH